MEMVRDVKGKMEQNSLDSHNFPDFYIFERFSPNGVVFSVDYVNLAPITQR